MKSFAVNTVFCDKGHLNPVLDNYRLLFYDIYLF